MAQEPGKVTAAAGSDEHRPAATAPAQPVTSTEIRSQIEHTREEMSQTIDAIQARLSPSRLIADAKETVKDATVGRVKRLAGQSNSNGLHAGGSVFDTDRIIGGVKANPIPAVLVGLAVAALIVRAVVRSRNGADRDALPDQDTYREHRRANGNGNRQRLLLGACAGLACLSAWRTRQSGFTRPQRMDAQSGPALRTEVEPATSRP